MDNIIIKLICGIYKRIITFLEVYLKEGNNIIRPIENGRVVISIGDIEIRIKRVLESILEVIELTVKVAL